MDHTVFGVPCPAVGTLSVMGCPPAEALDAVICDLSARGTTVVLSMLAEDEMRQLGVAEEAAVSATHGVRFLSHPIPDFGLPNLTEFASLIGDLVQLLTIGEHVIVHCRAGIGRSGMVAASVLVQLGQTAPDAIKSVSTARGVSIPDTVEQGRFVTSFEKMLNRDKHPTN